MERYQIAIVGSGPGGLSAGGRAAARGISHVVLEREPAAASVVRGYMRGKRVMSTPDRIPLRSDLPFDAGTREEVLSSWESRTSELRMNLRCETEVAGITGERGDFRIAVKGGTPIRAENVVLATGLGGNVNRLQVPGAEQPLVQYQLDDAGAHEHERIVVIGAGDAGIENAIALSAANDVTIINRSEDFSRARRANIDQVEQAIGRGKLSCYYNARPVRVGKNAITIETAAGETTLPCDRVIARLGARPPRSFLEGCGVEFPSAHPGALPEIGSAYECNVDGLHVVGALSGSPLIKRAMNQGFEVIEYILGEDLPPIDEPLLRQCFAPLGPSADVDATLRRIRRDIPVFSGLNTPQLRELMLDTVVHRYRAGEVVFEKNDPRNTFYTILEGSVRVILNPADPAAAIVLGQGDFFGELGLISGRRRTATIVANQDCVLLETSRRGMTRLIRSVDAVRKQIDLTAMLRQVQNNIAPHLPPSRLRELTRGAEIRSYAKGETILAEGDSGQDLHLIRSGSATVSKSLGGRDAVLNYLHTGAYFGEIALLTDGVRTATVKAAVATETIRLDGAALKAQIEEDPALKRELTERYRSRLQYNERIRDMPQVGSLLEFLARAGGSEAVDMLLIDEALCVRCDNCEKACAETHDGIGRLDREAGPSYGTLHVPTSCRHCELPHCMKDCPADAIHRSAQGEVAIDHQKCIGCGNCEANCPYNVIQLAAPPQPKQGVLTRLIAAAKSWTGEATEPAAPPKRKAYKCDMCAGADGGPACVRACPTGAAYRISPEAFAEMVAARR